MATWYNLILLGNRLSTGPFGLNLLLLKLKTENTVAKLFLNM